MKVVSAKGVVGQIKTCVSVESRSHNETIMHLMLKI